MKYIKILTIFYFLLFSICVVKANDQVKLKREAYAAKKLFNSGNVRECLNLSLKLRQDAIKQNDLSAEIYFTGLVTICYKNLEDNQKALFYSILGEKRFNNPNDSLQTEGYYFCAFF